MKNLLRTILVVTVMLGTYTGYANETLKITPHVNYVTKGNHISITDSSGKVIYSGRVNTNGNLSRLYDFSHLKDGIYKIEINKDFVIEIQSIEVKNKNVKFLKASNNQIFKPVFRIKDSRILLSKLALNKGEMNVELYFEGELIYSETVKGGGILNRVYKLDQTLKGNYTTIIKSDDRVFIENFRI